MSVTPERSSPQRKVAKRTYAVATGYVVLLLAVMIEGLIILSYHRPSLTIPEDFVAVNTDAAFARWSPESGLADLGGNTVFVLWRGVVRGSLTFTSKDYTAINAAQLADPIGRPVVEVDFGRHTAQWNEYAPRGRDPEPVATYIDSSGDFIPDKKIDWTSGESLCPDLSAGWIPCRSVTQGDATDD
jgi:hypothetical protein